MIDEKVKIHDRFNLEVKVGFAGNKKKPINQFIFNTWIFVPSSLDVTRHSYTKERFYRDLKTNIRLITPIYTLDAIASGEDSPLSSLERAIKKLNIKSPHSFNEYEYQIKMFNSIMKSALRESNIHIVERSKDCYLGKLVEAYILSIKKISQRYRNLFPLVEKTNAHELAIDLFSFGDEFMSFMIDSHCFKLINQLERMDISSSSDEIHALLGLVRQETDYKKEKGYKTVEKNNADNNRAVIFRRGALKKYLESELFLTTHKKEDAFIAKQFMYSLAAGLSMIFATIIAFSFQHRYGNFTMPFFTALVVGYMLKDRIKELGRYYFAHKLGNKYYDLKTMLALGKEKVGWCKDGFDFIQEDNVPVEVQKLRNRSNLLEASQKYNKEEVMLYRIHIETNNSLISKHSEYGVHGINRIIRYNLNTFIHKMDNPIMPLYLLNEQGGLDIAQGEKVYYLNFVFHLQDDEISEYHRYRITFNRNGILDLENIK